MALLRERPKDDRGRVTQGIPSLSSERRYAITERQLKRLYQQALVDEYTANDQAANAPTDGARPMTDRAAQAGIPLQAHQIERRLRKLNPNLWFERSKADPQKTGIYLRKPDGELMFIVGMEAEMNPEFTITVNDEQGNFKKMIPGWRRILMRLIRGKFVSETKAYIAFGPPNRDSERWALFTT